MSVAALYNLDVKAGPSLLRWSFNNMSEHFKIQDAIYAQFKINLPLFPLDPIPLDELVTWGYNHQAMHSAALAILRLQGNDLTSVDLTKPADVIIWTQLHADEHRRMAAALRLS